jgi:hypothetical protein
MNALLETRSLTRAFGGLVAVNNIDMHVGEGEIVVHHAVWRDVVVVEVAEGHARGRRRRRAAEGLDLDGRRFIARCRFIADVDLIAATGSPANPHGDLVPDALAQHHVHLIVAVDARDEAVRGRVRVALR